MNFRNAFFDSDSKFKTSTDRERACLSFEKRCSDFCTGIVEANASSSFCFGNRKMYVCTRKIIDFTRN